jgi:hypothetical protein
MERNPETLLERLRSQSGRTGDRLILIVPTGYPLDLVPFVGRYLMLPSDALDVIQALQQYADSVTESQIQSENEEIRRDILSAATVDNPRNFPRLQSGCISPPCGFIYLIHAVGSNRYKIGLASDIPKRMSQLSKQSAFPLALIASHPSNNMPRDEGNWHKVFEKQRVHGEWFELSDEQVWVFRDCAKARSEEA